MRIYRCCQCLQVSFGCFAAPLSEPAVENYKQPMFGAMSVIGGMRLRPREQLPPFHPGLFFKVGIGIAHPFVLFFGISLHELRGRSLYG